MFIKAMMRAAERITEKKVPVATAVAIGASYVAGTISSRLRVKETPAPVSELKTLRSKFAMKMKDKEFSYTWKKKLPEEEFQVEEMKRLLMIGLGDALYGAFLIFLVRRSM